MTLPVIQNQDRHVGTDVTVLSITSSSGAVVTNILGEFKKMELNLKKVFATVTAANDGFSSRRPVRWGEGSLSLEGYSQVTGSKFATLFNNASTATLQLQCASTGDLWQVQVTLDEYSTSIGDLETTDTVKLTQVGQPYYGANGSAVSALALGV